MKASFFMGFNLLGAALVLAAVPAAGCGGETAPADEAIPGLKTPASTGPEAAAIAPNSPASAVSGEPAPSEPAVESSLPPLPAEFANHVPTPEEADAAASKEITSKNARQVLDRLKKEIGGELGKKPR